MGSTAAYSLQLPALKCPYSGENIAKVLSTVIDLYNIHAVICSIAIEDAGIEDRANKGGLEGLHDSLYKRLASLDIESFRMPANSQTIIPRRFWKTIPILCLLPAKLEEHHALRALRKRCAVVFHAANKLPNLPPMRNKPTRAADGHVLSPNINDYSTSQKSADVKWAYPGGSMNALDYECWCRSQEDH